MRRIVFLDFDGVLNSDGSRERGAHLFGNPDTFFHTHVDPHHVQHLEIICQKAQAEVVVSSTWRHGFPLGGLAAILRTAGFTGNSAWASSPRTSRWRCASSE